MKIYDVPPVRECFPDIALLDRFTWATLSVLGHTNLMRLQEIIFVRKEAAMILQNTAKAEEMELILKQLAHLVPETKDQALLTSLRSKETYAVGKKVMVRLNGSFESGTWKESVAQFATLSTRECEIDERVLEIDTINPTMLTMQDYVLLTCAFYQDQNYFEIWEKDAKAVCE